MSDVLGCAIHWETFTTKEDVGDVLDALGGSHGESQRHGGMGHPFRVVHESGAVIFHGSEREDQPTVVNVSGEACERVQDRLIPWAQDLGGRVTRLDVALDLGPTDKARARLLEMRRAWRAGRVDTLMSAKSCEWHQSDQDGEGATCVFGGRTSERRLRAYDRRGPLRLEWQWRPDEATGRMLPEMVLTHGVPATWRGLSSLARFPMKWYAQLLEGPAVEWSPAALEQTELVKMIEQLRTQWGVNLWALQTLGMTLDDVAVVPENPKGEVASKLLRFADEAEALGYDGARLKTEVRCRLKSKRSRG